METTKFGVVSNTEGKNSEKSYEKREAFHSI